MRIKTLAMSGGKPKFSASGLGRHGRRAPFELRLPQPDEDGKREVSAWRSDVHLPLREESFVLPLPGDAASREGSERSHFWLYVYYNYPVDLICLSNINIDLTGPLM